MAEECEPEHPLHPERVDNERADDHRHGHAPERHAADDPEMGLAFKSNDRPQAGKTSCRITNEKAEATREMQLATNNRRGFMRSVSGAKKFAIARVRESLRQKAGIDC